MSQLKKQYATIRQFRGKLVIVVNKKHLNLCPEDIDTYSLVKGDMVFYNTLPDERARVCIKISRPH